MEETNGPDEFSQAVEIVRNFEQLGQIARSMVVGGLNEIRGEDILSGEGGSGGSGSGGSSGKSNSKDPIKPTKEGSEPSGKLTVSLKGFSSEYSGCNASKTITNTSPSDYWLSESGKVTNEWISYDFGKKTKVTKIALMSSSSFDINPKNITVQIPKDKDGNEWKDVAKLVMENAMQSANQWQVFTGFTINSQLVRLFFHDRHGTSGGSYFLVSAVRFYEK
eukprot:TRINITY_DN4936_c0_g1_i1.p1 TRINITY_DN4936_c0_g1~~TRINITY_DN4936_c0_g1_i1.p1  ORF type:complete len:221 (-),score=78.33 TRINITY_DN4936_c0_g1_i1:39-701(-)